MLNLSLNGIWQVTGKPARRESDIHFTSQVPGNLEQALCDAGFAPDPFWGMNAQTFRKYEFYDWEFVREFEVSEVPHRSELRLERLEPASEIRLNGKLLGKADNGLVEHIFECSDALLPGKNTLQIIMKSAPNAVRNRPFDPGSVSAYPFNNEVLWSRKPAHCWGWDITPRLAIGGIWGDVTLAEVPEHRFTDVFIQTRLIKGNTALLSVHYNLETSSPDFQDLSLVIEGRCGDSTFTQRSDVWFSSGFLSINVDNPKLWQVRNYGEPNLYDVTLTLLHCDETIASYHTRLGIRILKLNRQDQMATDGKNVFAFEVNGKTIHIQGTNHVPLDALHSRDKAKLPLFLTMLKDLNCNMVRVWGGGVYENDAFYDFCDENGILVWQDFMMGCASYPTDDDFCAIIRDEAAKAVRRLRQHPSIALWAGDNECDITALWMELGITPESHRITRETLPQLLQRMDPMRPYLPSSPYISVSSYRKDPEHCWENTPEKHLWGARNYFRTQYYAEPQACFISETGYHGCPNVSSIKKFISPENLWPWQNNPQWDYHASNPYYRSNDQLNYRTKLMATQIQECFGRIPDNLEEFAKLSQIIQAEAKKFWHYTSFSGNLN